VPGDELAAETWRQDRPTPPDKGETDADVPPSPPNGTAVLAQFEHERTALKGQIDALRGETQALTGLVAEVRSERDRERQRADHAFGTIDALKVDKAREVARADRAEQALADERNRADALRESLEVANTGARQVAEAHSSQLAELRVVADQARTEMAELRQADHDRKGRGRWARLRAAWRGE
jgi:chromosome segregation ATPase